MILIFLTYGRNFLTYVPKTLKPGVNRDYHVALYRNRLLTPPIVITRGPLSFMFQRSEVDTFEVAP